jgi:hypothetical protein
MIRSESSSLKSLTSPPGEVHVPLAFSQQRSLTCDRKLIRSLYSCLSFITVRMCIITVRTVLLYLFMQIIRYLKNTNFQLSTKRNHFLPQIHTINVY